MMEESKNKRLLGSIWDRIRGRKHVKSPEAENSDDVFPTPQVVENDDTATILFEGGIREFYSSSRGGDVNSPEVLVLHKNDKGNCLMTLHGMVAHERTETVDIHYDHSWIEYNFESKGIFLLNEQQAKTLLTSSDKMFKKTLAKIKEQTNFQCVDLTDEVYSQRSAFLKKDFELAKEVKKNYLDNIREQDAIVNQEKREHESAERIKKTNESTEKFLDIFSKFDLER